MRHFETDDCLQQARLFYDDCCLYLCVLCVGDRVAQAVLERAAGG